MPSRRPRTMSNASPTTPPIAYNKATHPHLRSLDLPLIPVAFIPPPFRLQEVEDTRKRVVLAALRGKRYLGGLWTLLLVCLGLLLLLLAWRRLVGNGERAQHGELDGVVRDGVLVRMRFRVDSQRSAIDHRDLFGPNRTLCATFVVTVVALAVFVALGVVNSSPESRPKRAQASNASPPAPIPSPRCLQLLNIYVKGSRPGIRQHPVHPHRFAGQKGTREYANRVLRIS